MKNCNEKIKSSLEEAMRLDEARLEEEMRNVEPHIFSEAFEKQMEELFETHKKKRKYSHCLRYAAAAAAVVILLVGSMAMIGSQHLRASVSEFDIAEWREDCFVMEGVGESRSDKEVSFDETWFGYMPEGFEQACVEESITGVIYGYENSSGELFRISATWGQETWAIDNEGAKIEVKVNAAGYECMHVSNEEKGHSILMWTDREGISYALSGNISHEELVKIMDGISN
ncbi:MAG: DUF4367 domain-containing protein [Lachnospiraceae bacterium]|nr:DUF4367 domain-containing protein [Lachnospiraceae bacterium]